MALTEMAEEVAEALDAVDAPPWAFAADYTAATTAEETDPEAGSQFRLEDNGQADWAMRKLARVHEQSRAVEDLAARQIEPINRWRTQQLAGLEHERLFWEGLLTEFHRGVVTEDPKAKSVPLPHGRLTSRQQQNVWTFDDEAFIAWATAHAPEFVRVKTEVDKDLAKKTLFLDDDLVAHLVDGEELKEVKGVTVTAGDRKFAVEPEGVAK